MGVLNIVWVSIDPANTAPSAMKGGTWISKLLSRSVLIGSVSDGVNLHDIVRDFTLASRTPV